MGVIPAAWMVSVLALSAVIVSAITRKREAKALAIGLVAFAGLIWLFLPPA